MVQLGGGQYSAITYIGSHGLGEYNKIRYTGIMEYIQPEFQEIPNSVRN